jgi:hypothetical protein
MARTVSKATMATTWPPRTIRLTSIAGRQLSSPLRMMNAPTGRAIRPKPRRRVGWRGQPTTAADVLNWFGRADVDVFVSTHTGLSYAQAFPDGRRRRLEINNGSAGLATFAGTA